MILKDKVCLITGCHRGIGAAIAKRFAQEGAVVYANARAEGSLDEICRELSEENHTQVIPVYFDVTDPDGAKKAVMMIRKQQGRLDVLVNNAGIMRDALIGMVSRQQMRDAFEVNVFAVMDMIQLANKLMSRQKSGSIINMASVVGREGNEGQLVYSASKGAVIALTKTAAKELAPLNIRVNAIAPGMIDTDMFRSIGEEKAAFRLDHVRMGRIGTPEEVADTAVYLASDLSRYVTGEVIGVTGGGNAVNPEERI